MPTEIYTNIVFNFMRDSVYISKHIDSIKKVLIIEEDEHSIWTYLLDSDNDNRIVMDGFVCSTGTIVKKSSDVKEFIDKDFAPPISEDFANDSTIQKDLQNDDFKIETSDKKIFIFIKGINFVILDFENSNTYSKSVSKAGPYGLPYKKIED